MSYSIPIYPFSILGPPVPVDLGTPPSPVPLPPSDVRLLSKDIFFRNDFAVASDKDYVLLEGKAAVEQAILHRLITKPGEFKVRPTYGVGIHTFVKRRNLPATLQELQEAIRDQLSLDERIDEVIEVFVENFADGRGINVGIKIRISGQELVFKPLAFPDQTFSGTIFNR